MTRKKESFISIIVIFKNEQQYIGDCIHSILSQRYENFELVLYNDNSTDNSADIVREFKDKRIKYYQNNFSQGIAITRNNALKKTHGKVIFFTDADCIVDKNWVTQGIRCLSKGYVGVEGKTEYIAKKTTIVDKIVENKTGGGYMTCNMCYRAETLKEINGFNTNFENMMEDLELAFRVMRCGKITFNPKMKVTHQRKFWTFSSMITRFKEQGRANVLMHKMYGDSRYIRMRIVFPTHLLVIILPPLLIIKAMKDGVDSLKGVKILLVTYLAYVVERISIWKTSMKEGDFIL